VRFKISLVFFITLVLLGALLGFQNCSQGAHSQPHGSDSKSSSPASDFFTHDANGDGYAKVTYMNMAENSSCAGGEESEVQLINDKFYQTVRDCQPLVTPADVTSQVVIMPHNPLALFLNSTLFEDSSIATKSPSDVMCRGVATAPYEGKNPYADIALQPTGEKNSHGQNLYRGYLATGFYNGNVLMSRESFSIAQATEVVGSNGVVEYVIDTQDSSDVLPPLDGSTNLTAAPQSLFVDGFDGSLMFQTQPGQDDLVVNNMECRSHTSAPPASQSKYQPELFTTESKNKCTFTLQGANGYQWTVDRYVDSNTSCDSAKSAVQTNNPNATVVGNTSTFVHDPIGDAPKTRCTFQLQGQQGYVWSVERYVPLGSSCDSEKAIVEQNNPNAKIISSGSINITNVAGTADADHQYMCTFTLQGQKGYQWVVERYIANNQTCADAAAIVRANNPNATIISSNSSSTGSGTIATPAAPTTRQCSFTLKGEKGFVWTVVRTIPASRDCASEKPTVQANNPKATIQSFGEVK